MSFRNIVLSSLAKEDFSDILYYTWQRWGENQRDRYAQKLDVALKTVAQFPTIGVLRPDLFRGCRVFQVERHSVFYHFLGSETVEILRILSTRMDVRRHIVMDDEEEQL